MDKTGWIAAQWPAPEHVKAGVTTRSGGVSLAPYDSLNLALHVEDNEQHVLTNRERLREFLNLPAEPNWLEQVHGCAVVSADTTSSAQPTQADASMTRTKGVVCAVMTADCLPVLITDKSGQCVAAVHAGWRGLAQGIILNAVDAMKINRQELLVWLGPAIGAEAFEIGPEVREQFIQQNPVHEAAFVPSQNKGKWMMDIYQVARQQLLAHGVCEIYGGEFCTVTDVTRFYSYRRDGKTGRMASLIWIEPES